MNISTLSFLAFISIFSGQLAIAQEVCTDDYSASLDECDSTISAEECHHTFYGLDTVTVYNGRGKVSGKKSRSIDWEGKAHQFIEINGEEFDDRPIMDGKIDEDGNIWIFYPRSLSVPFRHDVKYEEAFDYCLNLNPLEKRAEIRQILSVGLIPDDGIYLPTSDDFKRLRFFLGREPVLPEQKLERKYNPDAFDERWDDRWEFWTSSSHYLPSAHGKGNVTQREIFVARTGALILDEYASTTANIICIMREPSY